MAGPTYTYTPDTPKGPQGINGSQPEILANFQAINELIEVNHIGFNTPDNLGKHKYCQMPYQSENPETNDHEIAVFSQETPAGDHDAELFYRYPSNGQINQLTNELGNQGFGLGYKSGDENTFPFLGSGEYVSQLPNGFIIRSCHYVVYDNTTNNTGVIVFPTISTQGTVLPVFKYPPLVQVCGFDSSGTIQNISSFSAANITQYQFEIYGGTNAQYFNYVAIGF